MPRVIGASMAALLAAAGGIVALATPAAAVDSIAVDDSYAKVLTAPTIVVAAPGVLGNDQVRAGAVAMLRGTAATNGTVELGENGSFTYTPGSGFTGTDSFEYCIGDGIECDSAAATGLVSIVQPVAVADTYSTRVNQALTVADPGVLGNDQSLPMHADVTLPTPASSGSLSIAKAGGFTFTPATDFSGSATFSYCVGDGFDGCYTDDVLVTINVANPTALADSYSVQHDRVLTVPDPGVLANDQNVPSDGRVTQPGGARFGVLSPNSSKAGGFTYTPNPGFAGTDSFSYCVGDGFDGCFTNFATAIIDVVAGPAAPTNVSVHPGNSVIAVEFTETSDASVTGYTATCTQNVGGDAGIVTTTASDTGSPISVVGVVNGVLANCTVRATNAIADGFESQPAVSTTPLVSSNPGVALNPAGTALPGQLRLSFDTPESDGGAPIYRYAADCFISTGTDSTGIARVFGTSSPIVVDVPFDVPGFPPDNGLLVSCRLVAFNANGGSGFSANSASVRVFPAGSPGATEPGPPRGVAASPGNTRATVTFFKPLSNGGSGILDYTATCGSRTRTGTGSPLVVTGLTNGTKVGCTVTARNAIGSGPASSPAVLVRPATVPGAPRNVSVAPGNAGAAVKFFKPASNGGSGILDYTAKCGSRTKTGTGSPLVVTGLANGITVNCTVEARNAIGSGPASSPPVSVKPKP